VLWGLGLGGNVARKYVYLGRRVPDTGKRGLDNVREVRGVRDAIIKDRKAGKISKRTAASRMNMLKLAVMRDRDFKGTKRQKAIQVVNRGIRQLKKMNRQVRRRRR